MDDMSKAYIGINEEGIVVMAVLDNPEHRNDVIKEVNRALRSGLVIERVESSRVSKLFGKKFVPQSKARIRELERVINWLAEFMVNSDDDITIGEICICYNDPSLDIYMACPICDGNNPLSEALDKARKDLSEKSDKEK